MTGKPWCTCDRQRNEGWSHAGNQLWVHTCGKPSKMAYEMKNKPEVVIPCSSQCRLTTWSNYCKCQGWCL